MTTKEWCERLGAYDVRENAHEDFWTFCPCHSDQSPRMHVYRAINGGIVMKCFVCAAGGEDVCRALGLSVRELEGAPMVSRRRRRRVDQTIYGAQEPLFCLACGKEMHIREQQDRFAGGYIAEAECVEPGCELWMTRGVYAKTKEAARALLIRRARESWQRMTDKVICAKSASADAFAGEYGRRAARD